MTSTSAACLCFKKGYKAALTFWSSNPVCNQVHFFKVYFTHAATTLHSCVAATPNTRKHVFTSTFIRFFLLVWISTVFHTQSKGIWDCWLISMFLWGTINHLVTSGWHHLGSRVSANHIQRHSTGEIMQHRLQCGNSERCFSFVGLTVQRERGFQRRSMSRCFVVSLKVLQQCFFFFMYRYLCIISEKSWKNFSSPKNVKHQSNDPGLASTELPEYKRLWTVTVTAGWIVAVTEEMKWLK